MMVNYKFKLNAWISFVKGAIYDVSRFWARGPVGSGTEHEISARRNILPVFFDHRVSMALDEGLDQLIVRKYISEA